MFKPRAISSQSMGFQRDIICWMFLHCLWKGNSQNKDEFFSKHQNTENFESYFSILGNIFSQ